MRFIDLFAGIGGFRIAFENAGNDCVFSSEWDKFSQQTYFENHGEIPFGDITQINENDVPDHDILTAGFPCQPFSTIGKREGFSHPTQGTLFFDIVRIVEKHRPSSFLLENVPGLKSHDSGNTLKTIIETLEEELEYKVYTAVLNSADFGVPQIRKRLYLVGFTNEIIDNPRFNFNFPEPTNEVVGIGDFIETHATGYNISHHLQNSYIFKVDDGRPQIVDRNSNFAVKTLVSTYHKIQRLTGTFVADGETGLRLLSENECKAIMGFPRDFQFPVSRTQMYRQMGNSVVVPVVEAIANEIVETMQNVNHENNAEVEPELAIR